MNTQFAQAALVSFGIPSAIAALVRVETNDCGTSLTVGHDVNGRRQEVAVTFSSDERIAEILASRDDATAFVASGVCALPMHLRADAPAWLLENATARAQQAMRERARSLANRAATAEVEDLPFAA